MFVMMEPENVWDAHVARSKRIRTKACALCDRLCDTLYRIRDEDTGPWILACAACQQIVSVRSGYVYGGTWKGRKRH